MNENYFGENLFEAEELQEIQDRFCEAGSVYMACFGKSKGVITRFSGSNEERNLINEKVGQVFYFDILNRLNNSGNDIVYQDTDYPFIKAAGINVKVNNEVAATWVVTGVLFDKCYTKEDRKFISKMKKVTTEDTFYKSVTFLGIISDKLFSGKYNELSAEEASKRSRISEHLIKQELKKNEVMGQIMKYLDSDEKFEEIINNILAICGRYLDISSLNFVKIVDENRFDMIAEWTNKDICSSIPFMQNVDIADYPFMSNRGYIISSNSALSDDIRNCFEKNNYKAVVSMPLELNSKVIMYINFIESRHTKNWDTKDISFINDVKKVVQSIVSKRITKNSLASSYLSLEAILENVGCGVFVKDIREHTTLYANQKIRLTFNESIKNKEFDKVFDRFFIENSNSGFGEFYHKDIGKWFDVHFTNINWVDGRKVILCTVFDVTDRKNYQKKIERQLNNDFLTGLYNRMRCENDVGKLIKECQKTNSVGALLYIDLDDFKNINDGLGHQFGDVLLKAVSRTLRSIPELEDACYRMGGDEFIVVIRPECYKHLDRIIKEIREMFLKPWYLKGEDYYCTISMGVVLFPQEGTVVSDLIKKADIALYEAKKKGKNTIEYYNDIAAFNSFKRMDMEKNLRAEAANSFNGFEVYYQPVMNVLGESPKCSGAEALVRWNVPDMGLVSPGEFIPLAEYLGLINPMGNYILEDACKACKSWNDKGHPEYSVNVNLSVVQLLQKNIVKIIDNTLKKTGLKPENLVLEVTESLAINDIKKMKQVLGQIRNLGVGIALDDFGTGYSSLSHIKELPLNEIKVDQCFIRDIGEDDYSCAFVKMVGELADALKVDVCVEGVEEKEQYEIIKLLNLKYIQGYYFGKPMRLYEFENQFL
ncbi:diguanylate cyclase (GGDEF) domain-containing protein [Acetitomaculum ruminis DSM 5522]|uniref:Diguanylate cyclase (GGDEF) domain-containing protein n=1 Tax=Acetitomaculum ruminis DSM 5522 TaxID=1120918 RepID=A0A1I0XNK0_9FIRM|nr:EAL domain-containing protein [Acetitomaculum ruminis]SFB02591.1 diguanylate cyclase (GGDEF) domain-containing protein [Acetitomaculum ruminis DSM 5522]